MTSVGNGVGGDVILYNNGQRNPTGDEIGEDAGM